MRDTAPDECDGVRLIAFYLPQFHPIPENDAWWGKGFTEWTNVTKARPLFEGHYQPHLPADLGFYDLRVRDVMREQASLAKGHGIHGFCYHYYWFSGKRLLERPVDEMLADPEMDMPFCLCWANENWTRRWDAAENQVLIAQRYLAEDDIEFVRGLQPYFRDPRYIRLGGAPLLIVYRPQQLPDPAKSVAAWRTFCRESGIGEIHVCAALTHGNTTKPPGFDSVVDFSPHNVTAPRINASVNFHQRFAGAVLDYPAVAAECLERPRAADIHFRTVFPAWDNTARTGSRATMVLNSSPDNYEYWLSATMERTRHELPAGKQLVFVNAWNEWAEGCHLEPDRRHGHAYLQATSRVCDGTSTAKGFSLEATAQEPVVKRRLASDLVDIVAYHATLRLGLVGGALKRYPRARRVVRWLAQKGR